MDNEATELDYEAAPFPPGRNWSSARSVDDDTTRVAELRDGRRYQVPEGRSGTLADGKFDSDDYLQPDETPVHLPEDTSIAKLLSDAVSAFHDQIERDLEQDREEAAIDGEAVPTDAAVDTCMKLATLIAARVALAPRLKWAAFTEDAGGVSLVLQSLPAGRRLNYQVLEDGTCVSALCIDENMRSESFTVSIDDEEMLRERAAWVVKRA